MKKIIDFTKFRKGSKPFGRVIDNCPKCGKKGQKTFYPRDGEYMFAHRGYKQMGFLNIDRCCTILTFKCLSAILLLKLVNNY